MLTPDDAGENLRLYEEAERIVYSLISRPPSPPEGTPRSEIRRRAIERLEFVGNPHQQFKSIHIGGTSGKGSTSSLVASILTAAGYRTGLHVSPYLQVATEKLIIDGRIASGRRYYELVTALNEAADRWVAEGHDRPTYGEFWVTLTFQYFAEEAVDYAVIEVGAGAVRSHQRHPARGRGDHQRRLRPRRHARPRYHRYRLAQGGYLQARRGRPHRRRRT